MVQGTGRASLRWRWPQSTDACDTGWWPDYSTASSSPHHPDHRRLQLTYEAEIQTVQLVTNKQDCDGGHHGVIFRYPISYGHQGLFQSPSRGLTSPEELNHSFVHHNLVVLFAELLQSVQVFQRLIVPPSLWTVYNTLSLISLSTVTITETFHFKPSHDETERKQSNSDHDVNNTRVI